MSGSQTIEPGKAEAGTVELPKVPAITRADLERTAAALSAVGVRTPLVESAELSRRFGFPVWVKCEQFQPIGAFKIRGAFTAISRLSPEARSRGIITHSSGNHGQAVAYVAKHFGVPAVIVMPEVAPKIKVDGIRSHGAEIVFTTKKERERKAQELIDKHGYTMVAPYDNLDVIMGQATCAFEILEELGPSRNLTTLIAPVGGGGMIAGSCATIAALKPDVAAWAVEPERSPKLTAALAARHPVSFEPVDTIADGLVPPSTGAITLAYMLPVIKGAVTLTEDEIVAGVKFLFRSMGLKVEPSGATPVAALLAGKIKPSGPTACILTGGNVDPAVFNTLVS